MNVITPAQLEDMMNDILEKAEKSGDKEMAHREADELLCRTLDSLGYGAGVKIFAKLHKWYA